MACDTADSDLVVESSFNVDNPTDEVYVLPKGTRATYLNEGAANIIYNIITPSDPLELDVFPFNGLPADVRDTFTVENTVWNDKLLRLRKTLKYIGPTIVTYQNFVNYIKPLFEVDEILDYGLVDIKESGLVDQLNVELKEWEANPRVAVDGTPLLRANGDIRRHGTYLAQDPYGLLMKDMSSPKGTKLAEFKLKWLHQSPAAPKGSKRCRTCAKRARDTAIKGISYDFHSFCPLDLASSRHEAVYRAAKIILNIPYPQSSQDFTRLQEFCEWAKCSVISKLAALQRELDPKGVFAADPEDKRFLTAMTLRDCSLFLQIPDVVNHEMPNGVYVARLGDLDLKNPKKVDYWRSVEQPLIDEGWYMGSEAENLKQPLACGLCPEHSSAESR